MSLASLKEFMELELTFLILGGTTTWSLDERFGNEIEKHLPIGTALRIPLSLMPQWYRQLWHDPTQIDGRVVLQEADEFHVRVDAPEPRREELTRYSVQLTLFLRAVLDGQIAETR